jgi:hypothetical protein
MEERDAHLEDDFKGLKTSSYRITSIKDPTYNCVAYAVGDTANFWYDAAVNGYYWPPGAPSADSIDGWVKVFHDHGYRETDDRTLELGIEKIAIYASVEGPEHVARQKASGLWTSKLGKGYDIEHPTLESLEGAIMGRVTKIMKRNCKDGRRVLE